MAKRTNRVAWGLAVVLAVVVLTGAWVLAGRWLPVYLGLPPGEYLVGIQLPSGWHLGPQTAELSSGRIFPIGPFEIYVGPRLTR